MRLATKLILMFALVFLQGCVMSSYSTGVKLSSLEFVKANPFEQRFIFNMDIKNTHSKPLFVRVLHYKLMVNGILIHEGEEFIWQDIPQFSNQQVSVLVSTSIWGQLEPIFQSIKKYKEINYYLTGQLTTGSLFYQKKSYFNYSGTLTPDQLPLKKLQKFMPDQFKI